MVFLKDSVSKVLIINNLPSRIPFFGSFLKGLVDNPVALYFLAEIPGVTRYKSWRNMASNKVAGNSKALIRLRKLRV